MSNFKTLLAAAKLPERTVPVCLQGDLVAEFESLDRALAEAERKNPDSLEGNGTGPILDRMESLRTQMQEHTHEFRLRALPKPKFRALIAAHPPRRNEDGDSILPADSFMGLDTSTFWDALIRACIVDPELDNATWTELENVLTDRQYEVLSDAAWGLNRGDVDIPFSLNASRLSRGSAGE